MKIETPRLILRSATIEMLQAAIQGGKELAQLLSINIPGPYSEFGTAIFPYTLEKMLDTEEHGWWMYFPILKSENTLIGICGYKGQPNKAGMVEIGYEVAVPYRQKGLATEMATALTNYAMQEEKVKVVWAHTLAENNPSTKVLKKCYFVKTKELRDDEDGNIWRWEFKK